MTEDIEELKARLRAAQANIDVDKVADRYRDQLRKIKAEYDKAVARAAARRASLLKQANREGLTYYTIAQLTRTDGPSAGYGQEFIRKVCQSPDDPGSGVSRSGGTADPPAMVG